MSESDVPAEVDEAAAAQSSVVVRLGGGRYALPMDSVAEVGRLPAVTRVPGVPDWLAGVANWRGRVLAVLDVRSVLGAVRSPLGSHSRLVVLHRDGVQVGLATEGVDGVRADAETVVEPVLPTLRAGPAGLLAGHRTDDDGPVAILDLDALYALRAALPGTAAVIPRVLQRARPSADAPGEVRAS